jgi:hypothetical protein
METALLREKLHTYINEADEKKLEAIYTILENEIEEENYSFSLSEITTFHKRRENHLTGKSKSFSIEETINLVRKTK